MDLRLGDYECPSCGGRIGQAIKADPPPESAMPDASREADLSVALRGGLMSARSSAPPRPGYNIEKAACLSFFLLVQLAFTYLFWTSSLAKSISGVTLPGLLAFALVCAAAAAIVLYSDSEMIRRRCLGLLLLDGACWVWTAAVVYADNSANFYAAVGVVAGLIVWMLALVTRDAISE
jgi:hypothetical protein